MVLTVNTQYLSLLPGFEAEVYPHEIPPVVQKPGQFVPLSTFLRAIGGGQFLVRQNVLVNPKMS